MTALLFRARVAFLLIIQRRERPADAWALAGNFKPEDSARRAVADYVGFYY